MRIYLAGSYGRRAEIDARAVGLRSRGHRVTSTWHDGHHEARPGIDHSGTADERAGWAAEDLADIARADVLVYCADLGSSSRGGAHVEAGYALGLGKRLIVLGDTGGNVFYHLPEVFRFEDWGAFLTELALNTAERRLVG